LRRSAGARRPSPASGADAIDTDFQRHSGLGTLIAIGPHSGWATSRARSRGEKLRDPMKPGSLRLSRSKQNG
jgi:hypothetical protein